MTARVEVPAEQAARFLRCPRQHAVALFLTDVDGYSCDICYSRRPGNSPMASCRVCSQEHCDWDMCADCLVATPYLLQVSLKSQVFELRAQFAWRGIDAKQALAIKTKVPIEQQLLLLPSNAELHDYERVLHDYERVMDHLDPQQPMLILQHKEAPSDNLSAEPEKKADVAAVLDVALSWHEALGNIPESCEDIKLALQQLAESHKQFHFVWTHFVLGILRRITDGEEQRIREGLAAVEPGATLMALVRSLGHDFPVRMAARGISGNPFEVLALLTWNGQEVKQQIYRETAMPLANLALMLGTEPFYDYQVLGEFLCRRPQLHLDLGAPIDLSYIYSNPQYLELLMAMEGESLGVLARTSELMKDRRLDKLKRRGLTEEPELSYRHENPQSDHMRSKLIFRYRQARPLLWRALERWAYSEHQSAQQSEVDMAIFREVDSICHMGPASRSF